MSVIGTARAAREIQASSPFAIKPPSSSSPLDAQDHVDACDDGERSSSSGVRASLQPSSRTPASRRRPSVGDRDHLGAMFHESCDDGDVRTAALGCLDQELADTDRLEDPLHADQYLGMLAP